MSRKSIQLDRSLDELEGAWGNPPENATGRMRRCHELHATALRALSPEQLRLALSQQIGMQWIGDLALDLLDREPLLEADLYPGDLLSAALRLPRDCWTAEQQRRLGTIAAGATRMAEDDILPEETRTLLAPFEVRGGDK